MKRGRKTGMIAAKGRKSFFLLGTKNYRRHLAALPAKQEI